MAAAVLAFLLLFQFSAPEGPEGLVYNKDWPTRRLPTKRKGKWDAWSVKGYPGNGGQPVTLTPAETAQVEAHLKKIAEVVESTPYAKAQIGWYANRSAGWIRTRFATERFPLAKLPVESYYALYPFHLMDKLVTRNGERVWTPDWSHETTSIRYEVNGRIPGPREDVFRENQDDGHTLIWYADARPEGDFYGFPVYSGRAVIARKGRDLFRPVPLPRAAAKLLPLYREDAKTAEERLRTLEQKRAETESDKFVRDTMQEFEQEYGSWKTTRAREYEQRRKIRLDWIERARREAREEATPKEGLAAWAWYWTPKRALEAAERLAKEADGTKGACFEAASSDSGLYKSRGWLRATGGAACKPVMEANPEYYDASLPRTAPQLITAGPVDGCIDLKTKAPLLDSLGGSIPHGCNVHRAIWAEMDWAKLASVLAP
jgi:hypothetical protein